MSCSELLCHVSCLVCAPEGWFWHLILCFYLVAYVVLKKNLTVNFAIGNLYSYNYTAFYLKRFSVMCSLFKLSIFFCPFRVYFKVKSKVLMMKKLDFMEDVSVMQQIAFPIHVILEKRMYPLKFPMTGLLVHAQRYGHFLLHLYLFVIFYCCLWSCAVCLTFEILAMLQAPLIFSPFLFLTQFPLNIQSEISQYIVLVFTNFRDTRGGKLVI